MGSRRLSSAVVGLLVLWNHVFITMFLFQEQNTTFACCRSPSYAMLPYYAPPHTNIATNTHSARNPPSIYQPIGYSVLLSLSMLHVTIVAYTWMIDRNLTAYN